MGVQGLWELLAPVGRRVSVETLAGKKLAIDASIWMVQFMKAMRDEKGEMVRNAHLIGFFRRICKLLFLRTKPVFVFDGGTPALKRRTVIARRRQRENAQAKIRKTAEKLLLNHLKAMRVKELADNLQKQRKESELKLIENQTPKNNLKRKIVMEENIEVTDNSSVRDDLKEKNVVLEPPTTINKNDLKGKSVVTENIEVSDNSSNSDDNATRRFDQETLDAMLAASLAEEEDGSVTGNASTSVYDGIVSEEDDDGDEEMVLPVMDGKVDPAVLAALPPSMQLDLLVQMRERLMAENRQKYQKVKKAPAKFSELQIQSYLKTVAFRREINEVQKSASGTGVGGVRTSRIASEANREYIYSSSFTGDKQTLTSAGIEKNDVELQIAGKGPACLESVSRVSSATLPSCQMESRVNGPISDLNDVETYVDERGRLRVSRVRAMGIRMTRDLQRNLDLMKEIQQKEDNHSEHREAIFNKIVLGDTETFSVDTHQLEASNEGNGVISSFNDDDIQGENPQIPENKTAVNISFFEDEFVNTNSDDDDDLFAHLVAGSSVTLSSGKNEFSGKHPSWEEGIIDEKGVNSSNVEEEESRMSLDKENINDEDEVDWEEVVCDATENGSTCYNAPNKAISRGSVDEEADLDEAIRRSLEDFTTRENTVFTPLGKENFEASKDMAKQSTVTPYLAIEKEEVVSLNLPVENYNLPSHKLYEPGPGLRKMDHVVVNANRQVIEPPQAEVSPADEKATLMHKPCEESLVLKSAVSNEVTSECGSVYDEKLCRNPVIPLDLDPITPVELKGITDQGLDTSLEGGKEFSFLESKSSSKICSNVSGTVTGVTTEVNLADAHQNNSEAGIASHSCGTAEVTNSLDEPSTEELAYSTQLMQSLVAEKNLGVPAEEIRDTKQNSTIQNMEVPIEVLEASLDEEMLHLRQERIDLGEEQRKLERNAESVTNEMFAECQELLQMFGLPYIIAPMEAEAQCAYLESAKLVDGVVTDDSDVFLFGARSVYKNIFDDRKYVETYFMKDIESELGQSREQLIRMALLLGSDYTEGVSGIGIVNAVEVVHAFPEEDGLQKFREWLESPDPTILGKLDAQKKRGSKVSDKDADCSKGVDGGSPAGENVYEGPDGEEAMNIQKTKQIFMDKHRNVSKNWHIPSSFPSEAVVSAYVSPQVDKSRESFSWGKPDLFVLRKLCWEKFGWSNDRADDLLVPVLKEYNKHETQLRMEAFYTFNERFAKIRSQRIKKAVKGITGKRSSELMDDLPKKASKRRKSPSGVEEVSNSEKSTPKKSRRGKTGNLPVSKSGRGRGRGRGRGGGRGRGKEDITGYESMETISSDGSISSDELETHIKASERLYEVRKSTRPRKDIRYTENDSVDQSTVKGTCGEPVCSNDICKDPAYLEMGGGFCLDEENEESKNIVELVSTSTKDGFSGGGFCVDDEADNEPVQPVSGPTRVFDVDPLANVGALEEDTLPKPDSSTNSTAGLTAIPFLRRKRRKNS